MFGLLSLSCAGSKKLFKVTQITWRSADPLMINHSSTVMRRSRRKEKFGFLKQILEEETSDEQFQKAVVSEDASSEISEITENPAASESEKEKENEKKAGVSKNTKAGPCGVYPVNFYNKKLKCKNEACQTKLSSFPMFPSPEDTVWISDSEAPHKYAHKDSHSGTISKVLPKKKRKTIKSNSNNISKETDHKEYVSPRTITKNDDGTRKEFGSEHLLKQSKNPAILAWLHEKNRDLRKQRRLERKEKREKRLALQEERRQEMERHEESEKRVAEWIRKKRRQYSIALRRAQHDINKVSPGGEGVKESNSSQVPPNYKVVKSFNFQSEPVATHNINKVTSSVSTHGIESDRMGQDTGNKKHNNTLISSIPNDNSCTSNADVSNKFKSQVISVKPHSISRPKTAFGERESKEMTPRPKSAHPRPKTAAPSRRDTSPNKNTGRNSSPSKMQSMSYDEWLKYKREQDKKRTIEQKKELMDSHLESVISELGKERVKRIREGKKHIDTGLKNFKRTPDPLPSPEKNNKYKWNPVAKPRPEPQGCASPDSHHTDTQSTLPPGPEVSRLHGGNAINPSQKASVKLSADGTPLNGEELHPSKAKVQAILNAEMQKLRESTTVDNSGNIHAKQNDCIKKIESLESKSSSPKVSRPTSARPSSLQSAFVQSGGKGLTPKQAKKVEHDMDILGLLRNSDEEDCKEDVEQADMSTVRDNYFDYGSEVDTPHMKSNKFVDPSKRQSLDFQLI